MNASRVFLQRFGRSITATSEILNPLSLLSKPSRAATTIISRQFSQEPRTIFNVHMPDILLKPESALYHHQRPELLLYRVPGSWPYLMHHISSTFNSITSLVSSQETRDRFMALTENPNSNDDDDDDDENDDKFNGCIINTNIIGQADMGFFKVLTLFHDLNNPLFEKYPINLKEFMSSCGWALEQFHPVMDEMIYEKLATFRNIYNIAKEDPESVQHRFISMASPEAMLQTWNEGIATVCHVVMRSNVILPNELDEAGLIEIYEKNNMKPGVGDTKVMNVALLSARVEEIYPPPEKSEKTEDPDAPLEDDSIMSDQQRLNLQNEESKAQVIAQLEVLYELEQSATFKDKSTSRTKTHTRTTVLVGKFETCLHGCPSDEDMHWKICNIRPAVEFGYMPQGNGIRTEYEAK